MQIYNNLQFYNSFYIINVYICRNESIIYRYALIIVLTLLFILMPKTFQYLSKSAINTMLPDNLQLKDKKYSGGIYSTDNKQGKSEGGSKTDEIIQ